MSVQHRTAEVTDRAPTRHRLTFSTPLSASLIAVVVIAVVATAILLGPRGLFGPAIASSPSPDPPTPSAISSPGASAIPNATRSATPTPAPTPTATLQPTPTPVPAWTGLDWSEPIVLSGGQDPTFRVTDALWWHGRYIGTGFVIPSGGITVIPLFLESADGVTWDVVQEMEGYVDVQGSSTYAHPVRVVAAGNRLVAWSGYIWAGAPRTLWQSDDGRSWAEIDSASWRAGWVGRAKAIAGGPSGVVAIGAEGPGCCMTPDGPAIIGHSTNGVTWTWLEDAPVFAHASFTDVKATPDGFVLVGWVGETEAEARERGVIGPRGRPAAWVSTDGVSWIAADVEGSETAEGELGQVLVGADGLFAIGTVDEQSTGWASADGRYWSRVDELIAGMFVDTLSLSDGTRMLILGREDVTTTDLAAWASPDGVTWTRLAFSGSPVPAWAGFVNADGSWSSGDALAVLSEARLQREGLVVRGETAITPDPQGLWTTVSWIATATER